MAHAQPHLPPRRVPGGEPLNSTFSNASNANDAHNQEYISQHSSHHQTNSRSPPTGTQPNMMGPGVSWNPDPTGLPLYPSEETLAAEYRAFLDSYQQGSAPGTAPAAPRPTQAGFGYPREANDVQRHESRDSTSSVSYSTASSHTNYPSSDPYPPLNPSSHPQSFINSVDRTQHGQHDAPDRQPMQSLSPESYGSAESPPHGHPYQYQQYFPQDAQPYYPTQWMDNTSIQNPQISSEYPQQHSGGPTSARYVRPPASTPYNPAYGNTYPSYTHQQSTGVAPSQISTGRGSSTTNVGGHMQAQQPSQGRNVLPMPANRKPVVGVNTSTVTQRIPSNGSQKPVAKPQPVTAKSKPAKAPANARATKRQRIEEDESSSYSSEEESGGEGGSRSQQQGGDANRGTNRLPGACAPCKRLKMKCVFPEGDKVCQRCRNSGRGHLCVVGPRKPRQPSNKKELLLQRLREMEGVVNKKDAVIKSLLEQLQNPGIQISLKDAPGLSPSLSSATDNQRATPEERPVDRAIREWVEKAQASILSTEGYRLTDARGVDESDSSSQLSGGSFGKTLGSQMSPTKSKSSVSESGRSHGRSGLAAPDQVQVKSSPKLLSLPLETAPIGLLADLSLKDQRETEQKRARSRSKSRSLSGADDNDGSVNGKSTGDADAENDENAMGIARPDYFQPETNLGLRTIGADRKDMLEIMTSGLISPAEVDQLFKIFFDKLNVFISILDPALHTAATTFGRSPFLFTVVCAISSRYFTERPELYSIAMHFARRAAASSLIEGNKSIELCQAYILMSVYSMPSRKWEDAREWLYLGLAIRMAIDLNLHVKNTTKPVSEKHERELLNRTRTWFICYNLDRSASAQLGKPASIQPDPIIRSCKAWGRRPAWWKSSTFNDPFDLHLCAYTDLLSSITAEFQQRVYWDPKTETTGLRTDLDLIEVAFEFDDRLQEWNSKTAVSFATHSNSGSSQCAYRVQLLPFYVNYLRLVMLSLGFQQAIQKGNMSSARHDIVKRCLNAASAVLRTVVNDLAPTGFLRYAPDGHFVFTSFASAFLIKMLRSEQENLLEPEERSQTIELVERVVETLKSPRIAVDVRHTPMLYSRFLASLLAKYKESVHEEAATTEGSNTDAGLDTPPMAKQQVLPSDTKGFAAAAGVSRHRPSPSIEISPPAPEPGFDALAGHQQQQQMHGMFNPLLMDSSLFPSTEDINAPGFDASTVHPASTIVGGSQYDTEMADEHMLAPMLAVANPGFWSSMMLPGLSWPAAEDPWHMNLDMEELSQMGLNPSQGSHYQQNNGGFHS